MRDETDDAAGGPRAGFVAFAGAVRLASGPLFEVALAVRRALDRDPNLSVLVFDRRSAQVVDLDLRGSEADLAARYADLGEPAAKRGRPKLGVVAREVTLLPRHWDWLAGQPGGASITLRQLVEAARKAEGAGAKQRTAIAYRFMAAVAGDLPGFEEASRALFAQDRERLETWMEEWPQELHDEVLKFAGDPSAG